ncbi:AI-2E family transporter [Tundrisphaera lichenicola]|uniref:AI-2E family transporter n=1 Tax=Tundrisphaera lichenicola TaxID=2029860 RepID=UPI003EC0DB07
MTTAEIQPTECEDHPSTSMRLVAIILAFAAVHVLSSILVPFLLALVLSIALAPVARRLERLGLGRTGSSLACTLAVLLVLLGMGGLIAYQLTSIGQDAGRYFQKLGDLAARLTHAIGADPLIKDLGKSGGGEGPSGAEGDPKSYFQGLLRRNVESLGSWLVTGIGGTFGFLGGTVLFLAFLCYMLQGRTEWIKRLRLASESLGLRPRDRTLSRVAGQVGTYLGYLAMMSATYALVISLVLWLLGVPQPILWGVLTGALELIPFFGPVIAGALPALAALGSGDGLWQPLAVVAVFAILQTIEGYVVAPLLYGKAVDIDPVTVLFGVLFFGFLLGPAGLALAMPLMILLRGVLSISPDTPTLDALADVDPAQDRPEGGKVGKEG